MVKINLKKRRTGLIYNFNTNFTFNINIEVIYSQ